MHNVFTVDILSCITSFRENVCIILLLILYGTRHDLNAFCIDLFFFSLFFFPDLSCLSHYASKAAKIIKQVYSVLPSYDKIVPSLLQVGVWKLPEACNFTLGVPIGPMLAKPTKAVSEIIDKFQGMEFTCEYKYDGERAQVFLSPHCLILSLSSPFMFYVFLFLTCNVKCRYITWRMDQLRYTVVMQNGILGSTQMLSVLSQGILALQLSSLALAHIFKCMLTLEEAKYVRISVNFY